MTATSYAARAAIALTGAVTERGIGRSLAATTCRDCHTPTVRALDADICAFEVTLDPTPLDPLGETLAIATGRTTYDVVPTKTGLLIEPRSPQRITQPRRHPVLAQHRCGQPLPAAADDTDDRGETDEPPF